MAVDPTLLHRPAFAELLAAECRPQRWRSRSHFASEVGVTPSTVSMVLNGDRGLSDEAERSILDVTGWDREALIVPVRARPGDLETRRLYTAIERLREQVSAELLRGADEIAEAIRQRNGG